MRLFVDNLSNIDFSFLHPTRGLVGETWLASIELRGELDDQGMVVDFGKVKQTIRQWLDVEVDHRLLIPYTSPCLSIEQLIEKKGEARDELDFAWSFQNKYINGRSPNSAVALINSEAITTKSVARWCTQQLMSTFPESVEQVVVSFTPENIDAPYYHYSHGLKKHEGNCQRIAHGHRSRIAIWRNGELSLPDMQLWAERWQDIYIGTRQDLVETSLDDHLSFQYTAQQGEFFLELPRSQCYLIDTDSTIEHIAAHIADELKKASPSDSFTVKAFEGLAKGAIAER